MTAPTQRDPQLAIRMALIALFRTTCRQLAHARTKGDAPHAASLALALVATVNELEALSDRQMMALDASARAAIGIASELQLEGAHARADWYNEIALRVYPALRRFASSDDTAADLERAREELRAIDVAHLHALEAIERSALIVHNALASARSPKTT